MVVWTAFIAGCLSWLGGTNIDNLFRFAGAILLVWLLGFILLVVGTWSGLAVGVKRLHDRDKKRWWILLFWLGPGILGGWQNDGARPRQWLDLFAGRGGDRDLGLCRNSAACPARPVRTSTDPIRSAIRRTRPALRSNRNPADATNIADRECSRRPEVERWTGIFSSALQAASIARNTGA